MSEALVEAVFLHRDIDPLVFKHLVLDSKASLRLVSKAVKQAVDKTVRKVVIAPTVRLSVESVSALLNAGWDLEELVILLDSNDVPSGMLLLGGIRGWTNLKKLTILYDSNESDMDVNATFTNAFLSQGCVGSTFLESLNLPMFGFRDEHIKNLATLRWASNLKSLTLVSADLGPDSLHHIIKVSSALTSLELRCNRNRDLASRGVAPLAALTNLKDLDLGWTSWTGQGFAELAHSLTNLTSLKAGYNDFSGLHKYVSELSMPSLKKRDLMHCQLTPAFFSIKLDLPSLETLSLMRQHLCVDGVLEGFTTQQLPSLKCMDLGGSNIHGAWLAKFVAAGNVVCPLLEELDLSCNQRLGVAGMRALCNSPWRLKSLHMSMCNLGTEEINALAEGNFQWLRHLHLSHNARLKAEDLIALASTANMKNIESIY